MVRKKFTFKPERAWDLVKLRKRRPQGTSRNRRLALTPGRSGTVGSRAKRRRFSQIAAHLRPSSANAMLCIATASTNLIAGPLRHLEKVALRRRSWGRQNGTKLSQQVRNRPFGQFDGHGWPLARTNRYTLPTVWPSHCPRSRRR